MGAGLDQQVAQGGGLDRAGDDAATGGVGDELAEQGVLGAAADDVDDVDPAAGQPLRVLDPGGERDGEAVQDAADDLAGAGGDRWPVARQASAIRAGMSPGARNSGASGSNTGPPAGTRAAFASNPVRVPLMPWSCQVRRVSDSSHRPITLRR